jgi:hypothetical protein
MRGFKASDDCGLRDRPCRLFRGVAVTLSRRSASTRTSAEDTSSSLLQVRCRNASSALRAGGANGAPAWKVARDYDLLVMGTHGRGGFARWVLWGGAEKVLRQSLCSVLTVSQPSVGGPLPEHPRLRKILCAVDLSGVPRVLTLLHVVEGLPEGFARLRPLDVPGFPAFGHLALRPRHRPGVLFVPVPEVALELRPRPNAEGPMPSR